MIRSFFVLLSMVCGLSLFSQINESDTLRWQFRSSVTGTFQTGNVDLAAIRLKADLSTGSVQKLVFKSQNAGLYQAFYKRKADLDFFSRNYLYWKPAKRHYPFGIWYVSTNFRRKIEGRYFAGLGYTYQLIQKKGTVIKLSSNLVYEQTRFRETNFNENYWNGSNLVSLWRATLYTGGWVDIFENKIRFIYDFYWQPGFREIKNYRWQLEAGFDFPLRKGFSIVVNYNRSFEQVVNSGVRQTDQILSFGIAYQRRRP